MHKKNGKKLFGSNSYDISKRYQKNDENSLVLVAKMYVYEGIKRIAANSWVQIAKICLRKH